MDAPLLSVCLITYNHVKYIKQAIDSVLMQKVNFTWELIIADDFSTDGTREILFKYKTEHPGFIKLILQEKNVGPNKNWMDLITSPKSKYIAYFEGDDYWSDPFKLQKQVDFLEQNLEFVMHCHNARVIYEDSILSVHLFNINNQKDVSDLADIINKWNIPTASITYRRSALPIIPDWFNNIYNGDYALVLLLTAKGKVKYSNEVMSVYRKNINALSGSYNTLTNIKNLIKLFTLFDDHTNYRYHKYIYNRINKLKFQKFYKIITNKLPYYNQVKAYIKK